MICSILILWPKVDCKLCTNHSKLHFNAGHSNLSPMQKVCISVHIFILCASIWDQGSKGALHAPHEWKLYVHLNAQSVGTCDPEMQQARLVRGIKCVFCAQRLRRSFTKQRVGYNSVAAFYASSRYSTGVIHRISLIFFLLTRVRQNYYVNLEFAHRRYESQSSLWCSSDAITAQLWLLN